MSTPSFAFPTSFAQRRLWFLHQLEPDSPVYNVPLAIGLRGRLDRAALGQALDALVARHEALRTTFSLRDGEPIQVVAPEGSVALAEADLTALPADARSAESRRLVEAEAASPFDLARGPLLRARLLRREEDEHVLVLVMHHVVTDGWSMDVLFRELGALYGAFTAGEASPLAELPIQYPDFTVWQHERSREEALERQLAYWRTNLAGAPALLSLPIERPRPTRSSHAGASHAGASRQRTLPRALTRALGALARQERATLFMVLLAAFKALLARYTGRTDVVVGSPIAGRNRVELEGLIGFFVNSLALRTDLSGDPTFRELLGRVRETALGAYANQDLPFERVVEAVGAARVQERNPIFQAMFALQNMPRSTLALPGLTLRTLPVASDTAQFDLTIFATELPEGLELTATFRADLFEGSAITRLLGQFQTLLEGVVADPGQRLSRLPLLDPDERRRLMDEWNDTRREYPRDATIHGLFERHARHAPNQIAVVDGRETLTYSELNRRANRLAHALRRHGVGPDTRVAIALDRSAALIVAVLGILKAGGAYLPLDPDYPRDRLAFMLADAGVGVLVTQTRLLGSLPPAGLCVVCLDRDRDRAALAQERDADPPPAAGPEHLAYVSFTSGSTGSPKGVAVPHRAVVRLACGTDYVQLDPSDAVAQMSTAMFDAATFEIWGSLLNGARLVILGRDVTLSPPDLAAAIRERGITTMFLTTAHLNQLTASAPEIFGPLRHLLFGGEAVDTGPVRELLHGRPPARLLHVYGPTETTTFASWHLVREVPADAPTVPIGRPIANTQLWVMDPRFEPVPVGVAGELFIGGPGVARGYLNRARLTAERFVPDPFASEPGARLYRTGDLVRRLPDGALEFVGRRDHQVKIRGHRIEMGEIESALARHPAVRDCVVVAPEDGQGQRRLVAYLVAHPGQDDAIPALRAHLRDCLPEFMIPAVFVPLGALPLSPNGKVDRRALPAPEDAHRVATGSFVAPRSDTERRLAVFWAELLGVDRVGTHDDFFELGGHSLLAVKLFARIEEAFGRRLPLATLFQAPTLQRLAAALEEADRSPGGAPRTLVVLQAGGTRPPLVLVHTAWGYLFRYRDLAARLGPDQPVFGFESPVRPDGTAALRTVEALAAEYVRELREAQPTGPYYLCGYCWAGGLAFEMGCQLRSAGEEVALLALIDSICPGSQRWARIERNLRSVGSLHPRALPGFLKDRITKFVAEVVAGVAFRWSLRSGRTLLPRLRQRYGALSEAGKLYRPRPYPGRVTLFRAHRAGEPLADPYWGWDRVAGGGVDLRLVDGEHLTLLEEPSIGGLIAELRTCLQREQAAG